MVLSNHRAIPFRQLRARRRKSRFRCQWCRDLGSCAWADGRRMRRRAARTRSPDTTRRPDRARLRPPAALPAPVASLLRPFSRLAATTNERHLCASLACVTTPQQHRLASPGIRAVLRRAHRPNHSRIASRPTKPFISRAGLTLKPLTSPPHARLATVQPVALC